jgi:1,2-phenylacetyl-CoA epoxidase PaaB subunit
MNYEVLTRIKPGDDLKHIGSVRAPADKLARNYAETTYDEEQWSQMLLVKRSDLIPVTGDVDAPVEPGMLV